MTRQLKSCDVLTLDNALLVLVPINVVVRITELRTLHSLQKLFIVSNDKKLEVGLLLTSLDDSIQSNSQGTNIVSIEICGWFVKGNNLYS